MVGRLASTRSSARCVNVAFPFSQIRVQEPSAELTELAVLVCDLAAAVAELAPGPTTTEFGLFILPYFAYGTGRTIACVTCQSGLHRLGAPLCGTVTRAVKTVTW